MLKFGTDGIRGIVGNDLNREVIFNTGYSLSKTIKNCRILLGKDNRTSRDYVSLLFCSGAIFGGAVVTDVGIVSTPTISYLLKNTNNFDYGVMISASHNPHEYNGIKIFDSTGKKITINQENTLNELNSNFKEENQGNYGRYKLQPKLKEMYTTYLEKFGLNLSGDTILLDLSNGVYAYGNFAKNIYEFYKANVKCVNNVYSDGKLVNVKAGILNEKLLLKYKNGNLCDYAIAFDGDGDRVLIIDKYNNILNGDIILYLLAQYYNRITPSKKIKNVVGTKQTNLGIEKSLNSLGINLIRSDVGDKNVIQSMIENNSLLGAEQSGHVIVKEYLNSGDGLLASLLVMRVIKYYENIGEYQNIISKIKIVPQTNLNYSYRSSNLLDKPQVKDYITMQNSFYGNDYRILVRKSGSENKIRILVEGVNKQKTEDIANEIYVFLNKYDTL